jgi:DNA adenine methylase
VTTAVHDQQRASTAHHNLIATSILHRRCTLRTTPAPVDRDLVPARYQSPLRYPGAKSSLAPVIARVLEAATGTREIPRIDLLVEPFAGGASASLRLVGDSVVERVLLADVDPRVTSFWQAAAEDTGRLIDWMHDEWNRYVRQGGAVAVDRWDYWRFWRPTRNAKTGTVRLGTAMQCLFLNRTTFSGILHGKAGPIGGRKQESPYGIGCRWNPDDIEKRLCYIGHLYRTGRLVDVWCKDWRETLDDVPELYPQLIPSRVLAYLDPPYIDKASHLYRESFDPSGGYGGDGPGTAQPVDHRLHMRLAKYLRTEAQFRWLLSYDNNPILTSHDSLYAHNRMSPKPNDREILGVKCWTLSKRLVRMRYTASGKTGKRDADELLITTLPPLTVPTDAQLRLLPS